MKNVVSIFALFIVLFSSFSLSANEEVNQLQYLPSDTLMCFTVENFSKLRQEYRQLPFAKAFQDEQMKKFLAKPKEKLLSLFREWEEANEVSSKEYLGNLSAPSGQVVMALTGVQGTPPEMPQIDFVVIMEAKDDNGWKEFLEKLWENAPQEEVVKLEEDFMGTTIVYVKPNPEGENTDLEELPISPCYSFCQGSFIMSSNESTLKEVVARMHEEIDAPSLLDSEIYQQTMLKCHLEDSDSIVFINFSAIMDTVREMVPEESMGMVEMVTDWLGVNQLQALGQDIELLTDNGQSLSKGFVLMSGEPKGLMEAIQISSSSSPNFENVPADAGEYFLMHFDLGIFWREINVLVENLDPQGNMQFQAQVEQMEQQLECSISEDLIPSLGNRWEVYKDYKKPLSLMSERSTISLSLNQPEKLREILDRAIAVFQAPFQIEEYMEVSVYSMMMGQNMPPEFQDAPAFAIHNNQLIFSSKKSGLQKLVRMLKNKKNSLASKTRFKNLIKQVPGSKDFFHYVSLGDQFDYLAAVMGEVMGMMGQGGEIEEWLDWSLFPSAKKLKKFLSSATVTRAMRVEDGYFFESHSSWK